MKGKKAIVIRGKTEYVNKLAKHLLKEHPSTRKRLKLVK